MALVQVKQLAPGSNGQVITTQGGVAVWATGGGGGSSGQSGFSGVLASPSAIQASSSSDQVSSNSFANIAFDTNSYVIGTDISHVTGANNHQFTINTTGTYQVFYNLIHTVTTNLVAQITQNGSSIPYSVYDNTNTGFPQSVSKSIVDTFTAGDVIVLQAEATDAGSWSADKSVFIIERLGAARGDSGFSGQSGASSTVAGPAGTSGWSGQSGVLATPAAVQATNSANQSATNGSFSDIFFDTNDLVVGTDLSHSTSVSTDNFTANATGTYLISYSLASVNGSGSVAARVRINDSTVVLQSVFDTTSSSTYDPPTNTFVVNLSSGDFVTLQGKVTDSSDFWAANLTSLMIQRVAAAKGDSGFSGQVGIQGPSGASGQSGVAAAGTNEKQFEVFFANTTYARPIEQHVGFAEVLSYAAGADNSIDFTMDIPDDINLTQNFGVALSYHMSASVSGNVKLLLDYEVVDVLQDTAPASPTATITAIIAVAPSIARERFEYFFSIPFSALNANTDSIRFRLTRNGTDGVNDTNPANFNVENVSFRYTGFSAPATVSGMSGFSGSPVYFDRYTTLAAGTDYSTTPPSTSTITTLVDLTPTIKVAFPLRYKIGGTNYYGIVTAISSSLITISGAPLSGTIQQLAYGKPELVQVSNEQFFVAGRFADEPDSTLLLDDMKVFIRWNQPRARLVKILARSSIGDSGVAQPRVNASVNLNPLSTSNSNAGIQLVFGSWAETAVDINTTNYVVNYGDSIDISTDAVGTNGDAENLTVGAIFVFE